MNKQELTETEIRNRYIRPALELAGWGGSGTQIREEYSLTAGRILVRGLKAKRDADGARRADYVLEIKKNIPIAVVEAKDNAHPVESGIQQALDYAAMLGAPFAFSSNGNGFVFHDGTADTAGGAPIEARIALDAFPSPDALWEKYRAWKKLPGDGDSTVLAAYYSDIAGKPPRYYQVAAVNRTLEAIARGQNRVLLVMATGTGKTFTAFQIIWRLWRSKAKKRILYLADRNILIDQTMVNDFKPFKGAMAKLALNQKGLEKEDAEPIDLALARAGEVADSGGEPRWRKKVDHSYEIYLSLYQAVSGTEDYQNVYRQFKPDFFDLIVVDECHRGSAAEDSAWREILSYFSGATQIGMTATPSLRDGADNTAYFGDPVYEYTLKQGIADGYLAPYKVLRITLDKDLGWRPEAGQRDERGEEIEDREYNQSDMNRSLVLRERDIVTARRITAWLRENGRFSRTIVFCEDIDHAGRMRQALANENADLCAQNPKYAMKITGDDPEGKAELDNFINSEETYPVIACTSRLMTTGVDAKMCRLVVLDRTINSMTEFKQIIGRGTRIEEDYGKLFFTIMDFKQATKLFADPAFDGEAAEESEEALGTETGAEGAEEGRGEAEATTAGTAGGGTGADGTGSGEARLDGLDIDQDWEELSGGVQGTFDEGDEGAEPKKRRKFYVAGVEVRQVDELVQYLDATGKLMTESIFDFSKRSILKYYPVRTAFVEKWREAERKRIVLSEMEEAGVSIDDLEAKYGRETDPFDLICHVAYGSRVLTRRERADRAVRDLKLRDAHSRYGEKARLVIERLLEKYCEGGLESLEDPGILKVPPFPELGSVVEIYRSLGGKDGYDRVIRDLEEALYDPAS